MAISGAELGAGGGGAGVDSVRMTTRGNAPIDIVGAG